MQCVMPACNPAACLRMSPVKTSFRVYRNPNNQKHLEKSQARSTSRAVRQHKRGSVAITTVGRDSEDSSEVEVLQVGWKTDSGWPLLSLSGAGLSWIDFATQPSSIGAHTHGRGAKRTKESDGMQWQASRSARLRWLVFQPPILVSLWNP